MTYIKILKNFISIILFKYSMYIVNLIKNKLNSFDLMGTYD